ncbi:hypothetical protein N7456_001681 [Penicillium angulare]|uniref:Cerato-platanin n=1 Tax=Penicillium angulare TaxID=116970 RepID=A0A9W9KPI6_9EURO|nr:hypothetical protein N7456_001681 [Penicillium angulare]
MKCIENAPLCALLVAAHIASAAPTPEIQLNASTVDALDQWVSVSYEPTFDNGAASLNVVACSNGNNGLESNGYSTLGSLPTFPLIGASPTVDGWNSPNCGKCYELRYQSGGVDRTIHVLAVDACARGFDLSLEAMNRLTDGQGVRLGRVDATYRQVDNGVCGVRG